MTLLLPVYPQSQYKLRIQAWNVYFGFLQYENFATIIIGTEINILVSLYYLKKNNLLPSDTVPLNGITV